MKTALLHIGSSSTRSKSLVMGLAWWSSGLDSCTSNAGATGSIPSQETKIPHAT